MTFATVASSLGSQQLCLGSASWSAGSYRKRYLHWNICLQKGSVQFSSISFWFEVCVYAPVSVLPFSYNENIWLCLYPTPSQRTVLIGKMFKIPHQGPGLGFPLIIFSSTSHACSSELTCSKLSIGFDGISKKKILSLWPREAVRVAASVATSKHPNMQQSKYVFWHINNDSCI